MSPEVYAKAAPTMFKKGQIPHNYKEVGTEIINADGYVQVKVADPNVWKLKHRLIWEQAHGEIPEGYNVQFKNHNPLDIRLENLYLISKAEQMEKEKADILRYVNLFGYHPTYGLGSKPIRSVTYKPQYYDHPVPLYET